MVVVGGKETSGAASKREGDGPRLSRGSEGTSERATRRRIRKKRRRKDRLKEKNMDIEKVELRFHIWSLNSERASRFSRPIGPSRARFAAVEGAWWCVAGGTGASGPCLPRRTGLAQGSGSEASPWLFLPFQRRRRWSGIHRRPDFRWRKRQKLYERCMLFHHRPTLEVPIQLSRTKPLPYPPSSTSSIQPAKFPQDAAGTKDSRDAGHS